MNPLATPLHSPMLNPTHRPEPSTGQIKLLSDPLEFPNGRRAPGRAFVSAMTNFMSDRDGALSAPHAAFLNMRLNGAWGGVTTCAAFVRGDGQCWDRQLGLCTDAHENALAQWLDRSGEGRSTGSEPSERPLLLIQLHHGGSRAHSRFCSGGLPVGPVAGDWSSAERAEGRKEVRPLSTREVESLILDFAHAAARAERAGFNGCEIHGAHGYLLTQFLSSTHNRRRDRYGGPMLHDRARMLLEIVHAIRSMTRPDFVLGVRLSPLSYGDVQGISLEETQELTTILDRAGADFIHYSAWDARRPARGDPSGSGPPFLIDSIGAWKTRLKKSVSGGIWTRQDAEWCFRSGIDFVQVGRAALRHPDWPMTAAAHFQPKRPPYPAHELSAAGLDKNFIDYMRRWDGFVT